jgi:hypothetical protein
MDNYNLLLCQIYLGSICSVILYVSMTYAVSNIEHMLLEIRNCIENSTIIKHEDIDLRQDYINRSFLLKDINDKTSSHFHSHRKVHNEKQTDLNKEILESDIYKNSHELRQRKVNNEIENINKEDTKSWFNILN